MSFAVDICIGRNYADTNDEIHKITLLANYDSFAFVNETSKSNTKIISAIRYTHDSNNGYIDIQYSSLSENYVYVDFAVHCHPGIMANYTAQSLQLVAASPSGETVLATHELSSNVSAGRDIDMVTSLGVALATGVDLNNILTPGKYFLSIGANTIANLPYTGAATGYFDLIVMPRASLSRVWQILMDGYNGNIYQRRMTGASTWSGWTQL